MAKLRERLTFANVMSVIAVFIALGAGAYAAVTLPKNSVGSKQIKDGKILGKDVAPDTLTGGNINEASLSLPGGGAAGATGPSGATGPAGPAGTTGRDGAQGAAGQATAFARIDATGTLIGGAAESKGIAQTNVQHTAGASAAEVAGTGVYCIGGLSFTPTSATVSTDNTDSMPGAPTTTGGSLNFISTVAIFKGEDLGYCDNTHGQVRVALEQLNNGAAPTLANHGFFLWLEG
jgi:hypothetical protein